MQQTSSKMRWNDLQAHHVVTDDKTTAENKVLSNPVQVPNVTVLSEAVLSVTVLSETVLSVTVLNEMVFGVTVLND